MSICPCCGQGIPEKRMGVNLPPRKVQFFDLIAGQPGISMEEIRDRMDFVSGNTVTTYANQLNEYLIPTGWKVRGYRGWGYRFERVVHKAVDNGHGVVFRSKHAKSASVQVEKERPDVRAGARQVPDRALDHPR